MASYNKSFDAVLDKLLELSNKIIPDFTNYRNTDPLVILIKLIAAMSVSSNKYSNKYLNSKFVQQPSTIDEKSIYLLLEQFDMIPNKVIPGTVKVIFEYIGDVFKESVQIPEGSKFYVGEVEFTTIEDYYIKPYNSFVTMNLIEGQYKTQEFYWSNIRHNRLKLDSISVASEYVKVIIDDEEYTKVDHAEYSPDQKVFSVEYDMFGNYNVVFSPSTLSCINESSAIKVIYIESTGISDYDPTSDPIILSTGIEYNEVNITESLHQGSVLGYTVSDVNHTEVYNYERISSIGTTYRQAISTEDYTNLLNYYSGVAIAKAYDINSDESDTKEVSVFTPYLTRIVIAPTAGYYITDLVREQIINYLRSCGLCEDEGIIELINPEYVTINMTIGISADTENQSELLDMYSTISKTIQDYFAIGNIDYGSYISRDYISSLIARCDHRINYVEILEFSDNTGHYYKGYQLNAIELPLLGNLDIEFQFNAISLTDGINFKDSIYYRDVTYYLQGDRGEHIKLKDNNPFGIIHELEESVDVIDDKSFGYNAEFDIQLEQESSLGVEYRIKESSKLSDSDKVITEHPLTESVDVIDDKNFAYDAQFDIGLDQESSPGVEYKISESKTKMSDYNSEGGILQELSDGTSSVSDEKGFAYEAEMDVEIHQSLHITTEESFYHNKYGMTSETRIVTNYSGKSSSDRSEVNDDESRTIENALLSDRPDSFDKLYKF